MESKENNTKSAHKLQTKRIRKKKKKRRIYLSERYNVKERREKKSNKKVNTSDNMPTMEPTKPTRCAMAV